MNGVALFYLGMHVLYATGGIYAAYLVGKDKIPSKKRAALASGMFILPLFANIFLVSFFLASGANLNSVGVFPLGFTAVYFMFARGEYLIGDREWKISNTAPDN